MKKSAVSLLFLIASVSPLFADTPISLKELPGPVTKTIQSYFPASKPISAKKDVDDGKTKYKVLVRYKDITMQVDLLPTGKIVDLDM